jgi:multisubunit Na+/H+ antiporter MnhE subunit
MDLFTKAELVNAAFGLWLFIAGAVLPRFITSTRVLGILAIVGGVALAYLDSTIPHRPQWWVWLDTFFVILATGLALANSEVIFRRKNGYWRLAGPRAQGSA